MKSQRRGFLPSSLPSSLAEPARHGECSSLVRASPRPNTHLYLILQIGYLWSWEWQLEGPASLGEWGVPPAGTPKVHQVRLSPVTPLPPGGAVVHGLVTYHGWTHFSCSRGRGAAAALWNLLETLFHSASGPPGLQPLGHLCAELNQGGITSPRPTPEFPLPKSWWQQNCWC